MDRRALGLLAVAFALSGCESLGPDRVVLLPISVLDAPASVEQGEPVTARLTVEFGGCRRFERLHVTRTATRVTFRAIGRDGSGPNVLCPGDIRSEVVDYRLEPPLADPVTLVAMQPDASELTRTVRVLPR